MEEEWLSDTRKAVKLGGALGVQINPQIVQALGIKHGSIVEFRIRNTGKVAKIIERAKRKIEKEGPKQPGEGGVSPD